jgi:dystroglycan 1
MSQVTSYGGELHFTVTQRPRPGSAPLHGQPLVMLQGNGIILEHHTSREPSPGQPAAFTIPFREVSPLPRSPSWSAGEDGPYYSLSGVSTQDGRSSAHVSFPWQQAWQRPDGQPATREHLLMALAGIDTLLIQASYTQNPAESRCLRLGQEQRGGLGWGCRLSGIVHASRPPALLFIGCVVSG